MVKFGFELEAFCLDSSGAVSLVPSGIPFDECGWLCEIRSEPHVAIYKAIHLLIAEQKKVEIDALKAGVNLHYTPLLEIPRPLKVQAARRFGKGLIAYKNIYGYETHRNSTRFQTASLHVSVTNQAEWHYTDQKDRPQVHRYAGFVDHARLISLFDRRFKTEIAAAKRNPGFYEIKPDGRIEYRSLPNNVDLFKVAEVLEEFLK